MTTMADKCNLRRYQNRKQALTRGASIAVRHGVIRLPKQCVKCNGWHLSAKDQP